MQRHWIKIAAVAAGVAVIVLCLVPFFVNADSFRPMLQDQLSAALGRQVTLGHLSFSLFSGSLTAKNISVADDPSFGTSPLISAQSLHIGIDVAPFLFSHRVRVNDLVIDAPAIQLIQNSSGKWNFSSLGGSSSGSAPQQQSALPDLTVGELTIKNGSATVSSIPAVGKPFVYSNVDVDVRQFSLARSFPFQISASLPGKGTLQLSGAAGPLAQNNAADTPFHADLNIKQLDPVSAGLVDPSSGISMVTDIDAQVASDGRAVTATGKIHAARLQLARAGSPAPNPVDVDFNISDHLDARKGQVNDLAVHTGNVAVHTTGGFQMTPQAVMLDLHLNALNLPIDQVEQLLPAVGVRLPSGSSLHGGTLTANLAITGPATAYTIAGPVEIDNTQLAGFDLGSKIGGINPFGGTSNATQIQTVRTKVNSSPQSTAFSNIYASIPAIGTASGNGTVSPSGALDFNLVAKLNTTTGIGAAASKAAGSLGGLFGKVLQTTVNRGVPLTITGTASSPSIRANMGAMLK